MCLHEVYFSCFSGLLIFLDPWVDIFHQIWNYFSHSPFKYFLPPFLLSHTLSLLLTPMFCILNCLKLFLRSLTYFFYFWIFFLFHFAISSTNSSFSIIVCVCVCAIFNAVNLIQSIFHFKHCSFKLRKCLFSIQEYPLSQSWGWKKIYAHDHQYDFQFLEDIHMVPFFWI